MAETHVVSGLVAKRSEISGLVQHYQALIQKHQEDLRHLDAAIRLFSPDMDLRTLKPKEFRERNQYFKQGECKRMVLDILRCVGQPMIAQELARRIIEFKEFAQDTEAARQIPKTVHAALKGLAKQGLVERNARSAWQIAP